MVDTLQCFCKKFPSCLVLLKKQLVCHYSFSMAQNLLTFAGQNLKPVFKGIQNLLLITLIVFKLQVGYFCPTLQDEYFYVTL